MQIRYERFWCVQVPKQNGETVRRALIGMNVLERDALVQRDEDYLYFPIKHRIDIEFPDAELLHRDFEYRKRETFEEILGFTPGYEIIGDIAIIDASDPDAKRIAEAILLMHKNIKTVLGALTRVHGEFRIRDFVLLAGEPGTETVYREYGCRYELDLARVYFTPRLATERARIAGQVDREDTVVDMFAGVGPFSILIAKSAGYVIAIDKNPVAIEYLKKNARLNRINNIRIICGDVADVAHDLCHVADHVIMNLPHSAHEFLDCALMIVKPDGIIHYYGIREEGDLFEGAYEIIEHAAERYGMTAQVLDRRVIRSYSPHQYNIVMDVQICQR